MSVLYIRNSNDNFVQIKAIKGKDGNDYILTEQDKEDIANIVHDKIPNYITEEEIESTITSIIDGDEVRY